MQCFKGGRHRLHGQARGPWVRRHSVKKESPRRVLQAGEEPEGRRAAGWEVEGCTSAARAARQKVTGRGGLGASQLWAAPQDACRDLAVISLRDCDDGNKRVLKPKLKEA